MSLFLCTINGHHLSTVQNTIFCFNPRVPMRMVNNQGLTKTEKELVFAHKSTTIFVSTPVKPTGFFVFCPTNYPKKPPCGVSGKLSSTPKQYKVAHLLRFFGKYLCHLRFLTQCVTYYKSTLVYYNIFAILYQAAIHTRRDSNRSLFIIYMFINWRILCTIAHLCLTVCVNMAHLCLTVCVNMVHNGNIHHNILCPVATWHENCYYI